MSERPLSVLAVTLRYPPYVAGGYELLTRDAVEALRARGHRVAVLAGKGERHGQDVLPWLEPGLDGDEDLFKRSFRASNLERLRLHFHRGANARATARALRETGADVLLFFNLGLVSLAPIVAARRAGVPTLGYVADVWPANHWLLAWRENPRSRKKVLRGRLLAGLWQRFRRRVGLGPLFTCSSWLRARLVEEGLPPEDLEPLLLGVPPDLAALAEGRQLPERTPGEPLAIVCLSSLWEGKGQDVLLEAAAAAISAGHELAVTLAAGSGTAAFRERLEHLAAEPPLAGRVHFLDDPTRAELSDLLASSHVLVLPSTWSEPLGLVTLEGMAHGLAVVVSDTGGAPEPVREGRDGRLVPPGDVDALAKVLGELEADEDLRRRMGAAGRERAGRELSHRAFVDRLEERLREVAG